MTLAPCGQQSKPYSTRERQKNIMMQVARGASLCNMKPHASYLKLRSRQSSIDILLSCGCDGFDCLFVPSIDSLLTCVRTEARLACRYLTTRKHSDTLRGTVKRIGSCPRQT